jgi:predicted small integral membrane protein
MDLSRRPVLLGHRLPADPYDPCWRIRFPETPRVGVLRIETTRGDRLFITLLGSAFIHLAWLGLRAPPVVALLPLPAYAAAVFRWV